MEGIVATDTRLSNSPVDTDQPYLRRQLIAYLGNKRRLLPFLQDVLSELRDSRRGVGTAAPRFLDPFAGSGAVSRLAKLMGFQVAANDWEPYTGVLNSAFLGIDAHALRRGELFGGPGGLRSLLADLNSLYHSSVAPAQPYISRHFAPAATEAADYRHERLFYTRENALFLDRVREALEERYPAVSAGPAEWSREAREKSLLLALLILEASTHANTSGVFKAYHKGFGGHSGDALGRILARMELEYPLLVDGAAPVEIATGDAAAFLRERSGEILYLDPPYNSHQYGSNYFMLNTLARWDRPPVSGERRPDGTLRYKAGIREDWRETRSAFCYRESAPRAFEELFDAADARHIVLSYNTEGIVPLTELLELMEGYGRVQLYGQDYVKYRGGRQSLHRRTRNTEFLLVLTRSERPRPADRRALERFLRRRRLEELLGQAHDPRRLEEHMYREGDRLWLPGPSDGRAPGTAPAQGAETQLLYLEDGYRPVLAAGTAGDVPEELAGHLEEVLAHGLCRSRKEEVEVIARVLAARELTPRERRRLVGRLLKALRKFAYKRYQGLFDDTLRELAGIVEGQEDRFPGLSQGLSELAGLMQRRGGAHHADRD